MLQFSNSWGHLIITVLMVIAGVILILFSTDGTIRGLAVGLITTACGYWFAGTAAHPTPPPAPPTKENPDK